MLMERNKVDRDQKPISGMYLSNYLRITYYVYRYIRTIGSNWIHASHMAADVLQISVYLILLYRGNRRSHYIVIFFFIF